MACTYSTSKRHVAHCTLTGRLHALHGLQLESSSEQAMLHVVYPTLTDCIPPGDEDHRNQAHSHRPGPLQCSECNQDTSVSHAGKRYVKAFFGSWSLSDCT